MRKEIKTSKAPEALGPYSQAILNDGLLFISGQIGINPETGEVRKGVEAQAHQIFNNLKAICEEANIDINNTIKTTVLLANINDYATVNKIYSEYFTEPYPARAAYEVCRLPKGVKLEIEMIVAQK